MRRLPQPAEALLPHRPPMLFVETLVARKGDRSTAEAVLPGSGICISDERFLQEYFVELIAQTAAMASGYDAVCLGRKVNGGMLVGIDDFSLHGQAVPGRAVRIETAKTFEFGAIMVIHGEVYDGQDLLAAGDIKVWEDRSRDVVL